MTTEIKNYKNIKTGSDLKVNGDRFGNVVSNDKFSKFIKIRMYDTKQDELFDREDVLLQRAPSHEVNNFVRKLLSPNLKWADYDTELPKSK